MIPVRSLPLATLGNKEIEVWFNPPGYTAAANVSGEAPALWVEGDSMNPAARGGAWTGAAPPLALTVAQFSHQLLAAGRRARRAFPNIGCEAWKRAWRFP